MKLTWPELLINVFAYINALFNVNINMAAPECQGGWGYMERWLLNVSVPLWLLALHGLVFAVKYVGSLCDCVA